MDLIKPRMETGIPLSGPTIQGKIIALYVKISKQSFSADSLQHQNGTMFEKPVENFHLKLVKVKYLLLTNYKLFLNKIRVLKKFNINALPV